MGNNEEEDIIAEPDYLEENSWNYILGFILSPSTAWIALAAGILVMLFWNRIQKYLDNMYERSQRNEYDAKYHKNPDWVLNNFERQEIARKKMQELYNIQAAEHKIKTAVKEKQKQLDKLSKCTMDSGHRLTDSDHSKSHRPDYNPLMGDSSGRYKAPKKSKCPGGGCG